jgi:hypothetical protein
MSEQDCPLWPDVRALQTTAAQLDARVHALELDGRQEPASGRPAGGFVSVVVRRLLDATRTRST